MNTLESLASRLDDLSQIDVIRKEISGLLRESIENESQTLTAHQSGHLANAIGSLALNVNALVQPTSAWLRLCLSDYQKTIEQTEYRNLRGDEPVVQIARDDLLAALDSVVERLGPTPGQR